jgi:hypothetical protein
LARAGGSPRERIRGQGGADLGDALDVTRRERNAERAEKAKLIRRLALKESELKWARQRNDFLTQALQAQAAQRSRRC